MWKRITFDESIIIRKALRGEQVDKEKLKQIGKKLNYSDIYRILEFVPRIRIREEDIKIIENLKKKFKL